MFFQLTFNKVGTRCIKEQSRAFFHLSALVWRTVRFSSCVVWRWTRLFHVEMAMFATVHLADADGVVKPNRVKLS